MLGLIPFNMNGVKRRGSEFQSVLDDFFDDDFFKNLDFSNSANFKVDVKENEKGYLLSAELPGVKKENINVEYKDNNIIISAKREDTFEEKENNYIRRERSFGEFSRSFYIDNVDEENIKAKFENGELYIFLPKKEIIGTNYNKIKIE